MARAFGTVHACSGSHGKRTLDQGISIEDLTILLVEPSAAQRRIIINHLEAMGIDKVDGVATGEEALTHMERHPPDLVASAMYFDDMTGSELVTRMRGLESLADIPFMLVSSEQHPHNLEPVRQAGVIAILPKPFHVDALRTALENTVGLVEPRPLELTFSDVEELKVLIVDDSALSRRFLRTTFAQMGLESIAEAATGTEAVAQLCDRDFDLIVTDYNMPEMDGQALVEHIRQGGTHANVPILMVTCEQDAARLANVRKAGVSALCDKPFNMDTVREHLARLIDG